MKICIIEDDENFASLVARALEGLFDSVEIISDWEKAGLFADSNVAWIDLRMPSSFEEQSILRIEQLRTVNKALIIVVGSGFISPEIRARLERVGVDAVFYKNSGFSAEQVASVIIAAIMRASMRDTDGYRKLLVRALEWMHLRFPEQAALK